MNKYAKEYIRSFANVISQKVATELKLNEMVDGGKAVFNFLSEPFKDAYSNARDARQLYAAGQFDAAKAKNYQTLGNLGYGVATALPLPRAAAWGSRLLKGLFKGAPQAAGVSSRGLNLLEGTAMVGSATGGGYFDAKGQMLYAKSGLKNLQSPQGQDLIQQDVLQLNPYVNTDSLKKIQSRSIDERSSLLPHLEVLEKMTSGYNPQ